GFHALVLAFGAMAVDFGDVGAGFGRRRCAGLAVAGLRRSGDVGGLGGVGGVALGPLRFIAGRHRFGGARCFELGELDRGLALGRGGGSVLGRFERNWLGGDGDPRFRGPREFLGRVGGRRHVAGRRRHGLAFGLDRCALDFVTRLLARALGARLPAAGAAVGLGLGGALRALVLRDQRLPVGDRDLVIVGMDFAEGEGAGAVAAVVGEGGLQRRRD